MSLKSKLISGEKVLGTWNLYSDPAIVETLFKAGFDFVIHDMEHGVHSLGSLQNFVRAAELTNSTLLLRPPNIDAGLIQRALDAGCHGLMVPNIKTVECVNELIDCVFYPPIGNRGLSPYTRAFGYDGENVSHKMTVWNEKCFLGVLIEGAEGIKNLEQICIKHCDHLDVVYIGLYDLAKVLGATDDLMSDTVIKKVKDITCLLKQHQINAGILVNSPEMIEFANEAGIKFIAYKNDTTIVLDAAKTVTRSIKSK